MIFPAAAGVTEPFPTRPIRLIVPLPAGGGTLGTGAAKPSPDGYKLLLCR
jgi:hypothetical protein